MHEYPLNYIFTGSIQTNNNSITMNTKHFSLLFFSFILLACTGNSDSGSSTTADNSSLERVVPGAMDLIDYENIPGRQKATTRGDKGTTLEEGEVVNGLKEGAWVTYNEEGFPETLTTYLKGKKHGVALTFERNGALKSKQYYNLDVKEGEFLSYNGRRLSERKTYVGGELNGLLVTYYNDGKVQQEAPYVNGKLDGLGKWFNQQGALSIAYIYEDGELVDQNPELSAEDSVASVR